MSTIYVRVSLLFLATFLFGLVWSNDHKPIPKQKTVVTSDFERCCKVSTLKPAIHTVSWQQLDKPVKPITVELENALDRSVTTTPADIERNVSPLKADRPHIISVSHLSFPLPQNLSVGTYTVVDQFGKISKLSASHEELQSWGITNPAPSRTAYEITSFEGRWHFIRIEEPASVAADEQRPTQNEVQAAWGMVFDIAGEFLRPTHDPAADTTNSDTQQSVQVTSEPANFN